MCGRRRAGRALRRSGETVRGEEKARAHRARPAHLHGRQSHRLQGAEIHRIPRRAAEDQCRQDPAPRLAGERMSATLASAAEVVAFWREAGADKWFTKDVAFDEDIRRRFLPTHEAAASGKLAAWEQTAEGALALLILLDQFPRNMFRGQARAFATDPSALAVTAHAIIRGFDSQVPAELRGFFYLPFEHSENLADQEHGLALYKAAGDADGLK